MQRSRLSPLQLIALWLAGYAIACSGLVVPAISKNHSVLLHAFSFWAWLLASLSLLALGGFVVLKAQEALGEGVRQERWSREELRRPRRFFEHRAVHAAGVIALVTAVALLIVELITKHRAVGTNCLPLIYIPMVLRGIRTTLKEPKVTQSPAAFKKMASLQSEHWGGAKTDR